MSRQSKKEYIAQKRTKYDCAKSRRVKGRLIDEVVQTLDVSRKYAIRLLTGNRVYRPSKGRDATYSEATKIVLCKEKRATTGPRPHRLKTCKRVGVEKTGIQ